MKILVNFAFNDEQLAELRALATANGGHELVHVTDHDAAVAAAGDVEVALGNITPEICLAAGQLKWAHYHSAGLDRLITPEVAALPFVLTNMAGKYAPQGAEHAWALLLSLSRGIVHAATVRRWDRGSAVNLTGGTLLIIGLGGFGLQTLARAAGYDMTVLALDPVRTERPPGVAELAPPTHDNLHGFLGRADAVVVACPLTKETYHLIGAEELAAMKQSAYLVNVSRGGIIDEDALMATLRAGGIAGAGLDVCETEPVPDDSPLWDTPNLVVTPHRAGASQHRPREVFEFARENLARYLAGEPLLNVVANKAAGF